MSDTTPGEGPIPDPPLPERRREPHGFREMAESVGALAEAIGEFRESVNEAIVQTAEEVQNQRKREFKYALVAVIIVVGLLSALIWIGVLNRRSVTTTEATNSLLVECLRPAEPGEETKHPIQGQRCYEFNQKNQQAVLAQLDTDQRKALNELLHIVEVELDEQFPELPLPDEGEPTGP